MKIYPLHAALLLAIFWAVPGMAGENWFQHRGPHQNGFTSVQNLPLRWSQNENMRWKLELPGPGSSSPVVWGDRIFLTAFSGYDLNKRTNKDPKDTSGVMFHAICIDAGTGKKLWQMDFEPKHELFPAATSPMNLHGYTTATPAVDADAVYVSFANGGFYALSQTNGTYVVSTGREFKILAHNRIESDDSCFNASPVPLPDGRLLLRSDKAIYCVGEDE